METQCSAPATRAQPQPPQNKLLGGPRSPGLAALVLALSRAQSTKASEAGSANSRAINKPPKVARRATSNNLASGAQAALSVLLRIDRLHPSGYTERTLRSKHSKRHKRAAALCDQRTSQSPPPTLPLLAPPPSTHRRTHLQSTLCCVCPLSAPLRLSLRREPKIHPRTAVSPTTLRMAGRRRHQHHAHMSPPQPLPHMPPCTPRARTAVHSHCTYMRITPTLRAHAQRGPPPPSASRRTLPRLHPYTTTFCPEPNTQLRVCGSCERLCTLPNPAKPSKRTRRPSRSAIPPKSPRPRIP